MTVLSLQSHVVYGHVGNSAAVFALQRLGIDVWPVATVRYSNHPGHNGCRGRETEPDEIMDMVRGLDERGFLKGCRAVLSGYQRTPAIAEATLATVAEVRLANRHALWCCDPVLGDRHTGLYVDADLPLLVADRLMPEADIATPNEFELQQLTHAPTNTMISVLAACHMLQATLRPDGPRIVLCTSVPDGDAVATIAVQGETALVVPTPRLEGVPQGAGDLLTALFLARYLEQPDIGRALSLAVSSVWGVLKASVDAGSDELALIANQRLLVEPKRIFEPEVLV